MYLLGVAIVLLSIALVILHKASTHAKYPPGPFIIPFIGSPVLYRSSRFHLHVTLTKLAEQYGRVFRVGLGSKKIVVITDPDLIREAFAGSNPPVLLRFVTPTAILSHKGQSLFLALSRDFWSLMRRVCTPMIRNLGTPLSEIVEVEKAKLIAEMDKHVGQEVHLNPLFMFFTRNVFFKILLGKSWSYDNATEEQKELSYLQMKQLGSIFGITEFIPLLRYIGNKFFLERKLRPVHALHEFVQKMVDERRKSAAESQENARDLLDLIFLEQKEHPEITDNAVIGTVRSLLTAATATSADTLDWIILFLCLHPEIQEKCHQEIRDVLQGRVPTLDDQAKLPYLDRIIKETFRLRPAAPLAVFRVAERDFTLGGYQINKGDLVVKNLYGIGNMETFYKDHEKFDPDRWLTTDASNLIHFGVGPTVCLGMPIAKQEIFLTAAVMFQRYKFEIAPSSPAPDIRGEFKIVFNPKMWLTSISRR